jgi:hypothetical protein
MTAYATGQPVKPPIADDWRSVDYNFLLGFVAPAVRIDPHSHEIELSPQTDLRRIVDIVRDRGRTDPKSHEPKE